MFKNIIAIAGVPRSGTSWLGQIIDSSPDVAFRTQPLFSYAFKDAVNEDSPREEYEAFFRAIYYSRDPFLLQTEKREKGLYPTFEKNANPRFLAFKTCRYQYVLPKMLQHFENLKLIGIVRHPCGAINSWLKTAKEFPKNAVPRNEWRFGACRNKGRPEEFFGYYKWKEVAHLYLDLQDRHPSRVDIIRYDRLVGRPYAESYGMFDFLGLEVTAQTEAFLEACHASHDEDPYSVFKAPSVKDKWEQELDPYIASEILQDLIGTRLERFLA